MTDIAILKKLAVDGKVDIGVIVEIREIERIRDTIRRRYAAAKQQYSEEIAAIDAHVSDMHARCKHWSKTYHGDPSGGSDSHTTCDICGAEL